MQTPKVTEDKLGGIVVFRYTMVETTLITAECDPVPECKDALLGGPPTMPPTPRVHHKHDYPCMQPPCGPVVGTPFGKEPYESRHGWPWLKRNWPWAHRLIFDSPTYIGK